MERLDTADKSLFVFLIIASMFIACVICGNLIFQKFFEVSIFGLITFEISAGTLPYPLTFFFSDVICEIYGKRAAQLVVITALIANILIVPVVIIAAYLPATEWSPVNDSTFIQVFRFHAPAMIISLIVTFISQLADIRIYNFLRLLTHGKFLWFRNSVSTLIGQFIDTVVISVLLSLIGAIQIENMLSIIGSSYAFKAICAIASVPFFYVCIYALNPRKNTNSQSNTYFMMSNWLLKQKA